MNIIKEVVIDEEIIKYIISKKGEKEEDIMLASVEMLEKERRKD